jgi:transposase
MIDPRAKVIPLNVLERCSALELYKARSTIECTFNLLKQARRFATRYDKTLRNYQAVVALGCALLWLRI